MKDKLPYKIPLLVYFIYNIEFKFDIYYKNKIKINNIIKISFVNFI